MERRDFSGASPDGKLATPCRQPAAVPRSVGFWLVMGRRADGAGFLLAKALKFAMKLWNASFP